MDVLGLLSNISQVVDLLIKIGVMCSIYCVDVKNAPRDVRRLLKEVDRLTVVIKELELLLKSTKGSSKIESPGLRQAVFDLRRLLAELVAKLNLGAKHARAVWPFTKRDVHDLIAEIERQKANITLNINIEQTSVLLNVHQEIVLSKLRVAEAATFDSSVDGEESYCLQGTRSSIIEQIQHWSINPNSQSVFWLNGMAGTGKSTISRTIAKSFANEGVLGASFFFKRGEGDRGRTTFLFTTIAAQLVRRMPSLAPHIREILDTDPLIHEKSLNDQFQTLILDPLKKSSGCWPSTALLIVIDALDECDSEGNMRLLINVLSKAQHTDNPKLKFFVTSRPELPIRLGFGEISGKYDNLLLAAVPMPTIEHDLDLFMRHQLYAIKTDYNMSVTEHRKISPDWPGEDTVRKLIAASIPLFIMAATICRFLRDRRLGGPHHQLSKIIHYQKVQTSGLDMTYLPILDRLVVGLSSSSRQEVLNKFRYLIGSIITLAQPLSIGSLSHVLGISTDIVEDQLDLLHSVLSVPNDLDTPVRLLHLSFRDFLVDSEKKQNLAKYPFWVDEQEAHSVLFLQCLKLLTSGDGLKEDICSLRFPGTLRSEIDPKTIDACLSPAVRYACLYWVYHWNLSNRGIGDNDEIHQFLRGYMLNWLEALSLMGRSAESVYMVDDLLNKLQGENTQNLGDLLRDARRFILANMGTLDKAPLQIYSSALIFAPEKSIVRSLFKGSIPSWLSSLPAMQHHWDPCLATLESQNSGDPKVLAFPSNDKFLSIIGRKITIWDIRTTSRIEMHQTHFLASVNFSSDSGELLYLSGHKVLQIVDAATRICIAEFNGHTDRITEALFSPDARQLASTSRDGTLKIWDRATRKCLVTYDYNDTDRIGGFSPDGLALIMVSDFSTIQLLNSREAGRKLIGNIDKSNVNSNVFSPSGQKLAYISVDDAIQIIDILSGFTLIAQGAMWPAIGTPVFLSDDSQLICPMEVDVVRGHAIGFWSTSTAKCDHVLEGHRAAITKIILSDNEMKITSASYDKTIRVWDARVGTCIAIYTGHDEKITSITYSYDEKLLISADASGTCKVWDINIETKQVKIESHEGPILEAVFSPDKRTLLSTAGDCTVKLWDSATGKCSATGNSHQFFAWTPLVVPLDVHAPYDYIMKDGLFGWPRSVQFSPDSSKFISACEKFEEGKLKLWDATTGHWEPVNRVLFRNIISIAFSPDGATLVEASRDGILRCFETASQKLLGLFGGATYNISSSAYSPDGTHLVFACDDGIVRLCRLSTEDCKEMSGTHGEPVLLVAISTDSTKLASKSKSILKIWDVDTKTCIAKYTSPPKPKATISQMVFSPNSQYLMILYESGNPKIRILNTETGNCVQELDICGLANHVEFDSTGSNLVTNVGLLAFNQPNLHHELTTNQVNPCSDVQQGNTIGLGLSRDGEWITWDTYNMLWLPPSFRVSASDIDFAASRIALGSRLGRLLLIGIDSSKIPAFICQTPGRHTRPLS